jgi:signal transduction histidine kinase
METRFSPESSEALQAEVERLNALLAALNEELAETNRGVVALYAELEDKAAQLREASELKSRFLSYMSHEFRTPLVSITSITRLLMGHADGPLSSEQEKQIEFIQASAQELTEMVSDLLDLAKVEAGRVTISPQWFDMVNLFSALRGMFKPLLDSETVALIFEEPVNVPQLYTDDQKLAQILRNFISNALKFTVEGEVRVTACCIDETHVEFAVADTGIGISADQQQHLFKDFIQLPSILQRRLRGSGLGLSLSRRLAELLGGRVSVQSELNKGSIFRCVIPIRYISSEDSA